MSKAMKIKTQEKALIQRYLIWCYKITREDLEKIDRKFTQVKVDQFVLKQVEKAQTKVQPLLEYSQLVNDFKLYIFNKEKDALNQKFLNGQEGVLNSKYSYLQDRFHAIEDAIRNFLGDRVLAKISLLYEQEMTRRIIEFRDH